MPVREGTDVTVMITPDRLATIRRAARRAVRKYDLVQVAIGRENCSTSSSARGTRTFGLGMPIALNEISNWPAALPLPKTLLGGVTVTVTPAPPRSAPPKMPPTFTPESIVTEMAWGVKVELSVTLNRSLSELESSPVVMRASSLFGSVNSRPKLPLYSISPLLTSA